MPPPPPLEARLGLPGLAVRVIDPRGEKRALVHAITDRDNALLTVPEEIVKAVNKRDAELEPKGDTPQASEGPPSQDAPSRAGSAKEESPSAPKRGRKKR